MPRKAEMPEMGLEGGGSDMKGTGHIQVILRLALEIAPLQSATVSVFHMVFYPKMQLEIAF